MKAHKTSIPRTRPVKGATARIIIGDDGQVLGEVVGHPSTIARVQGLIDDCAECLGCRFDVIPTDDPRTIHVNAVPRKDHQIKAQEGEPAVDPRKALLHRIFIDDRPAFPGSILDYLQ